jgi:hypothetical protein
MVVGAAGIAGAYASAFLPPDLARVGPWVMAVSLPLCMVAVMALGAIRQGHRLGALAWPLCLVLVLTSGGFLTALLLPPETAGSTLVFGLPARAAAIIYGVGLLPLFVLPIAYALTFDRVTLTERDVQHIRDVAKANTQRLTES